MKHLLLLAVLTAGAATARAQEAPASTPPPPGLVAGPGRRPAVDPLVQAQRQSQRLAKELGLNADQQAKVQQILLSQRQDLLAARQQADEQLRAVLTPEQYTKYQQLLTQRKQQMLERRQQNQGGSLLDD